ARIVAPQKRSGHGSNRTESLPQAATDPHRHHTAVAEAGGQDARLIDAELGLKTIEHGFKKKDVSIVGIGPATVVVVAGQAVACHEYHRPIRAALKAVVTAGAEAAWVGNGLGRSAERMPTKDNGVGVVRIIIVRKCEDVL